MYKVFLEEEHSDYVIFLRLFMRHTVMALFPAFAEVETKRDESSSKGGEYILYITDLYAGISIWNLYW